MSAPDTNIKRQAKRHWPLLISIAASLLFSFVVAIVLIGVMAETEEPAATDDMNPMTEESAE